MFQVSIWFYKSIASRHHNRALSMKLYYMYVFLLYSAFDMEREREWRQRENALKVQIAQLEATLKADLGEKGGCPYRVVLL